MVTVTVEVIEYTRDDIVFPFDGADKPLVRVGRRRYGTTVYVDPTPAYGHDAALAREVLEQVAEKFPVDWPVTVSLLPAECTSRTNGATHVEFEADYNAPTDAKGNYPGRTVGDIYLSAKRIPIHPAMTRYLVAHEYGHVVEEWLNKRLDNKLHDDTLMGFYRQLRKLEKPRAYGAGEWHCTPGEVFANDFRILVCGIETEFWPHPGIERPETSYAIRGWWDAQRTAAGLACGV